jgi:hypothetical protein
MALPVTVPNTFAGATASIPLSQLDANFNSLSNAINGIANGVETLANINVTNAAISLANITTANVTNFQSGNAIITGGNVTHNCSVLSTRQCGKPVLDIYMTIPTQDCFYLALMQCRLLRAVTGFRVGYRNIPDGGPTKRPLTRLLLMT